MTTTKPKRPTRKQAFVASITAAGINLKLSKNTINALAKFALKADGESNAALLDLIAQPDPYGSLNAFLPFKIRDAQAEYTDTTEAGFALWVKDANLCFHTVDAYVKQNYAARYADEMPTSDGYISSRFVEGLQHYSAKEYTSEQLTDLALISAAAHGAYMDQFNRLNGNGMIPSINDGAGHCSDHFWCNSIFSQRVIDLVTSNHGKVTAALRSITDHGIYDEASIIYVLEGGIPSLAAGAL